MTFADSGALPRIISGPVLRDVCADHLILWFVSSVEASFEVAVWQGQQCLLVSRYAATGDHVIRVGEHAWIFCVTVKSCEPLPSDVLLGYEILCSPAGVSPVPQPENLMASELKDLCYPGSQRPEFVICGRVGELLHGSCRKPHHHGDDGLCVVDELLNELRSQSQPDPSKHPALLMMSGDQVYVDDVSGPMLSAVRQVVGQLGLHEESLDEATISHSSELDTHSDSFYRRTQLLPSIQANKSLQERFFGGVRKPIFTTQNAGNHLISLSEMFAMYFLVWSPVLWRTIDASEPSMLRPHQVLQLRYQREQLACEKFVSGLHHVRRAMANIPVYMIFDDHDVTDDWNLSRSWETSAYQNLFSRRIIGNALIAYGMCQAWGNSPNALPKDLIDTTRKVLEKLDGNSAKHDQLIGDYLSFEGWSYTLNTRPKVVVLDTRTRRWRAENNASNPSGLMDWEALSETQQLLIHEPAVVLVSPAPIFGVKLIEVIQRVFTWCGQSLMVDAENWMAHPGSANVILNIFRHKHTPHVFTILSGDVHYSFAYDVRLRHREASPHIWQITSSGILNRFPQRLLKVFDLLNRWLFASRSPLNWFTRRRHMRVRPRRPSNYSGRYANQRLVNGCGIGRVVFDEQGAPVVIEQVFNTRERVQFHPGYESDWVD